jgi:hypothetical protein
MPRLAIAASSSRVRSIGRRKRPSPSSGRVLPVMMSIIVVLPAPFGPMMARISPGSSTSDRPLIALKPSKETRRRRDRAWCRFSVMALLLRRVRGLRQRSWHRTSLGRCRLGRRHRLRACEASPTGTCRRMPLGMNRVTKTNRPPSANSQNSGKAPVNIALAGIDQQRADDRLRSACRGRRPRPRSPPRSNWPGRTRRIDDADLRHVERAGDAGHARPNSEGEELDVLRPASRGSGCGFRRRAPPSAPCRASR